MAIFQSQCRYFAMCGPCLYLHKCNQAHDKDGYLCVCVGVFMAPRVLEEMGGYLSSRQCWFPAPFCLSSIRLAMHFSVHPSILPFVSSNICSFIHPSIHPSIYPPVCLSSYLSTHPHIHLFIHPYSIYPFFFSSIYPCIHLSIHPSVHLSICPFIHLSVRFSICLFICLSV